MEASPTLSQRYPDTTESDFLSQPQIATDFQKFRGQREHAARVASHFRLLTERIETRKGEIQTANQILQAAADIDIARSLFENAKVHSLGMAAIGSLAANFLSYQLLKTHGPEIQKLLTADLAALGNELADHVKKHKEILKSAGLI